MTFRLRVAPLAAIGYLVFAAKQKQPSLDVTVVEFLQTSRVTAVAALRYWWSGFDLAASLNP
jgi:hypothetical protein